MNIQRRIIEYLDASPKGCEGYELAKRLGLTPIVLNGVLSRLKAHGKVTVKHFCGGSVWKLSK